MSDATAAGSPATDKAAVTASNAGLTLFLVGFLVLFLELACIRWFAAYVVFLQFFTNVIMLASFLGMSCGCLAAGSRRDWLKLFPLIVFVTVGAAIFTLEGYKHWQDIAVDMGAQSGSPQEVFFGTEYRNPDVARFTIPIDAVAGTFFVLVALMFAGLGQQLGRAFDVYPDRIKGYALNIGGSIAGIVAFSVMSFANMPPLVWFTVAFAGIAYLLWRRGTFGVVSALALAATLFGIWNELAVAAPRWDFKYHEVKWSPYYAVDFEARRREILVNTVGHQVMVPFDESGSFYSIIHLLKKYATGTPFEDVMVIGAGSGNDLAHALKHGVKHIDAVEIDPVIREIGINNHPDQPYADPRITKHLDDGRHYVKTTDKKYDLVVYALVDSLILHSGYANLRLESYLFTEEALADVARVLKPGGTFVSYNYFRQGWIVERVAAMAEKAFGCPATVISLPYKEVVDASTTAGGFSMIIGSCAPAIVNAFKEKGPLWLNTKPPLNMDVDGFTIQPETLPEDQRKGWEKVLPSKVTATPGLDLRITDDWPFLYIHDRMIPDLSLRAMVLIGVLGLAMVFLFMPGRRLKLNLPMFFLGAAFMLLETKAVVQLALLFGSTWTVNSAVFFTVLVLILLANLVVIRMPAIKLLPVYIALFALIAANLVVPTDIFLEGGTLWRYGAPCALALGPMFFAGIIFAVLFRDEAAPDHAFGSNIAGSIVGGLAEALSMVVGFKLLLLVAAGFYVLSAIRSGKVAA